MKKLPIGIQNFREIIEDNYHYVDKTKYIYQLTENGKYYFLSRPRRFGKSLFVDTIKEAFSGNQNLFKGLYLENHWDWNKKYPVIHFDFSSGIQNIEQLIHFIQSIFLLHTQKYNISITHNDINIQFSELIRALYEKHNERVVILIDEYDKPILDNIEKKQLSGEIRELLKGFYSVLKGNDAYIKFVFITGVTKFNKVSIFSGLNQLNDITIDEKYSTLCGYTHQELINTFQDRIKEFDINEIKKWYNGYNWLGEPVYNPFDILLFLDKKEFYPYWFATGTPTFLIKLIKEKKYYLPQIENIEVNNTVFDSFDIDNIEIENLLFQTGYITIKNTIQDGFERYYIMSYPNYEVKTSLNRWIVRYMSNINSSQETKLIKEIREIISNGKVDEMKNVFYSFFSSIPYQWYINNNICEYEGYYAGVLYALISSTGFDIKCEDTTNKGRMDMVIQYENKIYIIEFKIIKEEKEKGTALQQIKRKRYFEKYQTKENKIYLIGIEFDDKQRNIANFEYETL